MDPHPNHKPNPYPNPDPDPDPDPDPNPNPNPNPNPDPDPNPNPNQVSLGVATLLHAVPVHLGSAHQAGALTLFSLVLFALHSCRVPHAGRMAARLLPARPPKPNIAAAEGWP